MRRHQVLRSSFTAQDGEPVQQVSEEFHLDFEQIDISGLEAEEREPKVQELVGEQAGRPFDLEAGGLLRLRLLRLGEQEHVLLLTMHHIVADGWSLGVMMRELGQLYEAYREGREPGLKELEIQYSDYAVWQREWLQGEVLEKELGYWREQLAGMEGVELPVDHARPAVVSYRGSCGSTGR